MTAITARLADLRGDRDIPKTVLAATIGVHRQTVAGWDTGAYTPRLIHAVAYANVLGRRIVLLQGGREVAEGVRIADGVGDRRRAAALSQRALSERLYLTAVAVEAFERNAGPTSFLGTLERYLVALGYELALASVVEAVAA